MKYGLTNVINLSMLDLLILIRHLTAPSGLVRLLIVAPIPNFTSKTFISLNTSSLLKLSVQIFNVPSVK